MNIGILTFHSAANFGAVLQAYGLQESLGRLGHQACVADYVPRYAAESLFDVPRLHGLGLASWLRLVCRALVVLPVKWRRRQAFGGFVHRWLRLQPFHPDKADSTYDAFVFGSDQIWNAQLTGGGDPVYWGDFPAARGKRLVAYAASAGSVEALPEGRESFKALEAFKAVGVRERSLLDRLAADAPALSPRLCLDPVLLAGREVFDGIAEPIKAPRPYLLLFTLDHSEAASRLAHQIAAEKHLEVVELLTYTVALRDSHAVNVATPGQFVSYVKRADYVVTSSFHGTAFSLLYQKQFCVVCPDSGRATRMADLLQELGLADRLVSNGQPIASPIDYASVQARYERMLAQSKAFLREALQKS